MVTLARRTHTGAQAMELLPDREDIPDHVPTIACNPEDGCLRFKGDKPKATVLSPVHSVPWHVYIHDIPATKHHLVSIHSSTAMWY